MKTKNITSVKILRHIADLHEAGIISDKGKIVEEYNEYKNSGNPIEAADYWIARLSQNVDVTTGDYPDWNAAIAKNQRRLDWMNEHPDPTKTPVELWKEAKRAAETVRMER